MEIHFFFLVLILAHSQPSWRIYQMSWNTIRKLTDWLSWVLQRHASNHSCQQVTILQKSVQDFASRSP